MLFVSWHANVCTTRTFHRIDLLSRLLANECYFGWLFRDFWCWILQLIASYHFRHLKCLPNAPPSTRMRQPPWSIETTTFKRVQNPELIPLSKQRVIVVRRQLFGVVDDLFPTSNMAVSSHIYHSIGHLRRSRRSSVYRLERYRRSRITFKYIAQRAGHNFIPAGDGREWR